MHRSRPALALVAGVAALAACRSAEVRVDPNPQAGDRAQYQYEIVATITSALDDAEPKTTEIDTTLVVDQTTMEVTAEGIEAAVTLRRDGGTPASARALLDPTGAIRNVELVAGLTGDDIGLSQLGALLPPAMTPPHRALAPGEDWKISVGPVQGRGRLVRLGVEDDTDVAVVRISVTEEIDEAVTSGATVAVLAGTLVSTTTAAYDLADGSVHRSSTRSTGSVRARVEPPIGVDANAVLGTITYDIQVRTTRVR